MNVHHILVAAKKNLGQASSQLIWRCIRSINHMIRTQPQGRQNFFFIRQRCGNIPVKAIGIGVLAAGKLVTLQCHRGLNIQINNLHIIAVIGLGVVHALNEVLKHFTGAHIHHNGYFTILLPIGNQADKGG